MEIRTVLKTDLTKPVKVQNLNGNFFSQDNMANAIYVEVTDNGEPVTLSGGITGYVVRGDGYTVVINGTIEDGKAKVVLNEGCYRVTGAISVVVKAGTTTIGACHGYVYRSSTDSIVDPEHLIPSLNDLLDQIDNCRQATEAANTAAEGANQAKTAANNAAQALEGLTTTTTTGTTTGADVSHDETDGHYNIDFTFPVVIPTFGTPVTLNPGQSVQLDVNTEYPNSPLAPKLTFMIPRGDTGTITNAFGTNIQISESDSTMIKAYIDAIQTSLNNLITKRLISHTVSFTAPTATGISGNPLLTADHVLIAYQFYDGNGNATPDTLADFTWTTGEGSLSINVSKVYEAGSMVLVFGAAPSLIPGGGS